MSFNLTVPTTEELSSFRIIAEIAANNPHWKKLGGGGDSSSIVATILSVMLLARELGVPPLHAVSGGINNIQGKFELSARTMNMLIRKNGHKISIRRNDSHICRIWGQRIDTGEEIEVIYTIEEAARSGLVKPGGAWYKNPEDMLFARCISRLARRLCPDCIAGCYIEGEIQDKMIDMGSIRDTKEEIEAQIDIQIPTSIEEEVVLDVPEGIDEIKLDMFISQTAERAHLSINSLKKKAKENFDKFIEAFKVWEQKNPAHVA